MKLISKTNLSRLGALSLSLMLLFISGCAKDTESSPTSQGGESGEKQLKITITKAPILGYSREANPVYNQNGFSKMQVWTETAQPIYEVGGIKRAVITNNKSMSVDMNEGKSILEEGYFNPSSIKISCWPDNISAQLKRYLRPEEIGRWNLWKTVYYGLFATFSDGANTYSIIHGENKNMMIDGESGEKIKYNNTVKAAETVYSDSDYSYADKDNWDNYFAFLCSSWSKNEDVLATGNLIMNDNGPVVWPDNGYIDDLNNKISSGPRHPCMLIHDNYIYLYYLLDSKGVPAIKAARAPLSEKAAPGSFKKYHNGKWEEPALPEGFNKDDRSFVYKLSGMSTKIIESHNPIQFAVARVKDTPYFVGLLEETGEGGKQYLSISASKDLVNWTKPQIIKETVADSWDVGNLHYPKIYSRDFSTSMEVDKNGFYVVGTSNAYGGWLLTQYMPLVIDITEE